LRDGKEESVDLQVNPSTKPVQQNHDQFRFVDPEGYSMASSSPQQSRTVPDYQAPGVHEPAQQTMYNPRANAPASTPHAGVHDPGSANDSTMSATSLHQAPAYAGIHPNAAVQAEYQPHGGPYDYPAWDDSLNWIPISVYPSPFDGELEHDFSFLFPPVSDSSAMGLPYDSSLPMDTSTQMYQLPSANRQVADQSATTFPGTPFHGIGHSPNSSISNDQSGPRSGLSSGGGFIDGKKKRRKSAIASEAFAKPRRKDGLYAFPQSIASAAEDPDFHPRQHCSMPAYEAIVSVFNRLCLNTAQHLVFQNSSFPDIDSINRYIDLYFQHFHNNFPLIHRPSFGQHSHWTVILAVATVGSTFVRATYSQELRDAFQEFLRRVVSDFSDDSMVATLDIAFAQTRILNVVSLVQADGEQARRKVGRYHADLSRWCLESGVLQLVPPDNDQHPTNDSWQSLINVESLRRIAYLSWLLDTSLAYLANVRPLCNMDDARTPMPCPASLWEMEDYASWQAHMSTNSQTPSLCVALENLYSTKTIDHGLSDLCQILLVNALFQRTWEVGTHIKQPLSEWVPTGKARGFLNTPSKDDFWLPLYPLYANWRNSACDCLDAISWQAASVVAKASGIEHDLVLHLHLARIILLTPFQEIQDLLFSLIGRVDDSSRASFYVHDGSYQPRNQAKLPQIRKITWRWLREDQHKARLAMIHAGSVLWHVRRYSSASIYEPLAVYLASIVLWTYGSYKSAALERHAATTQEKPVGGPSGPEADLTVVQPSRVERKIRVQDVLSPPEPERVLAEPSSEQARTIADSDSSSETSSAQPEFIHLDRPCDDEMIQHFVRNGHNMTGHMSNVGDICKAPRKVLTEGAKLLRSRLSCWGVSREYHDILIRLSEMRKGH
jgi:hypothetical protein